MTLKMQAKLYTYTKKIH